VNTAKEIALSDLLLEKKKMSRVVKHTLSLTEKLQAFFFFFPEKHFLWIQVKE
jgi:hypothetical protein